MDENASAKNGGIVFSFLIIQAFCVAVMLITLFAVKLFFKETFYDVKGWYKENVCVGTDMDEVLEGHGQEVAEDEI